MISIFRRSKNKDALKQGEIKDEFKTMRSLDGTMNRVVAVVGFLLALFHLYTGFFGTFSDMNQRATHWTVISVMIFLLYPTSKRAFRRITSFDFLWGAAAAVSGLYILLNWDRIAENAGVTNSTDIFMGVIAVVVAIEATRVVGPTRHA
jgi:TRAP-type uncharacterized transport system fused permease subunit